jgi:hypothetical protein
LFKNSFGKFISKMNSANYLYMYIFVLKVPVILCQILANHEYASQYLESYQTSNI